MFKSASTTQFQNTGFTSCSYSTLSPGLYDSKSILENRPKKAGVKFQIETDKENTLKKESLFQSGSYTRSDKHTKTWTGQRFMTQADDDNKHSALKQLTGGYNFDREPVKRAMSPGVNPLTKLYQTDGFGFSSKNIPLSQSKKFIEEPHCFQRSNKQCKSMKIIPSFNLDDDSQIETYKPKKNERKFQKFQAYNELLKQSQNLIEKYKKLQEEKSKLRSDLKNQIQNHSKSSKKIMFLEETQANKRNEKPEAPSFSSYEIKSPKQRQYKTNYSSNKYSSYETYESPNYESKYETKFNKFSSSKPSSMNKTFSSNEKSFLSTQESSYLKSEPSSYTCGSGFGLSKSASSKKIDMSRISLNDFELGKCLGSGAFGQVFPAKHKKTGWLFALKKVPKEKVKYMLEQFIQEIKIQLFLDHPNIVKLYSFFDDQLHFYILMEYMQGGSLYSYLKKQKTLTLQQTSTKLREVCQGLQHMHEHQILHRDIKPENIVMCHNVSKLCDFGWSAICKDRRTTYCGTLDYVSPQIIGGDGYDDSVDVWCVGVLTYELLVGKTPFFNISRKQTMKKILDCNLEYPSTMPQVAVKFVKNILKKNPDHRVTVEQILKDPLLRVSSNPISLF